MLEGKVDAVIGVDTHRDSHAAAILDRNGGLVAELTVPSDQAGSQALLGVVTQRAPGRRCWALEGTGCYGAGLASFLADRGEWVVEIDRPKRPRGRSGAKNDPLDAIRAGREALSRDHLANPRQRGHREALRVLQLTRSGAVKVAADARRQLKALLVTAPEPLRQRLRGGTWLAQTRACAALTAPPSDPVEDRATVRALRLTAERVLAAHAEANQLEKELRVLVAAMAPTLLVLQPHFSPSLSTLPMTATSTRLMTPAPPRPAKHPRRLGRRRPDQQAQQPADLGRAQGHQRLGRFCALSRPPCPPRRGRAGRPGTPGPASTR
jgi:transposase